MTISFNLSFRTIFSIILFVLHSLYFCLHLSSSNILFSIFFSFVYFLSFLSLFLYVPVSIPYVCCYFSELFLLAECTYFLHCFLHFPELHCIFFFRLLFLFMNYYFSLLIAYTFSFLIHFLSLSSFCFDVPRVSFLLVFLLFSCLFALPLSSPTQMFTPSISFCFY